MDKAYLYCRLYAALRRINLSVETGNTGHLLALNLRYVVLARMLARKTTEEVLEAGSKLRASERATKKAKEAGIEFKLAEARIAVLRDELQQKYREQIELGSIVMDALDGWQRAGATLPDLCNLCNRNYNQFLQELEQLGMEARKEELFSGVVCAFDLDYKDLRDTGWISEEVDAPLTHSTKAYMLDLMLNTESGKRAAHEALEECFPEIMENALTLATDADGVKHLIDRDGVEVGTLDGEEG